MPAPPSAWRRFPRTHPSRSRACSKFPEVGAKLLRAPDWVTARPVAHRGLHDAARGIVENMPAAARAAIAGTFAIECDIQLSADGEAMVYHDDELDRLTEGSGPLRAKSATELKAVTFKATAERMMTLA